jgi:malate dehydrogenase
LGAAGGIGQPLSLLLKLNPRVSQLALYDIRLAPGKPLWLQLDIAALLTVFSRCRRRHWSHQHQERGTSLYPRSGHLSADAQKVRGYDPTPSGLAEALKGAEIVLIPAGVPRKPGMSRDGMW